MSTDKRFTPPRWLRRQAVGRRKAEEAQQWLTAPLREGVTLDKDHDKPLYGGPRRRGRKRP